VFIIALSLPLAALSPALPAVSVSSVISGAAIAVCFAPGEDCTAFAARAINNAESEILVSAYGLTTGSGIVEGLVRAKERGVDVRLIADKTTPCERGSGIEPLAAAGVPVWIDDKARIAHTKTMVIDGAVTLTGSMNWTNGAARNSEDLNLISSRQLQRHTQPIGANVSPSPSGSNGAKTGAVAKSPRWRALMSEVPPPSRPQQPTELRRVTVRVPEHYAEDLRRFARDLRTRQPGGSTNTAPDWRRVSPSAELLVDPECQARGNIRDTRARGADRFRWSVLSPDQSHTVAAGHTGKIARGRWLAETALRVFVEDWRDQYDKQSGDG
jgi:phosphatidylserine/phosphatidylglycerophosphate/cardiolipin synthase-like enzyme